MNDVAGAKSKSGGVLFFLGGGGKDLVDGGWGWGAGLKVGSVSMIPFLLQNTLQR